MRERAHTNTHTHTHTHTHAHTHTHFLHCSFKKMQLEFLFLQTKHIFTYLLFEQDDVFLSSRSFVFFEQEGLPLHLPTTTTKEVAASGRKVGS